MFFNNGSSPVININDSTYTSGRYGLNVWNGTAVFQNVQANSSSSVTDNFDGPLGSAWTWSAPWSGPTDSFVNGKLRISVPNSNIYDQWTGIDNAPKVYRTDMGSGDWTIETNLHLQSYTAGDNFHTGIIANFGTNDYLIFGNLRGQSLSFDRPGQSNIATISNYTNPSVYLRLRKVGTTYYADYKVNSGEAWTNAGSYTYTGTVNNVGFMTKTWSNVSEASDFDYFTLTK